MYFFKITTDGEMQWLMKLMREYKVFGSNLLLHKYKLVAIRLKTPILWSKANLKPCKKVRGNKKMKVGILFLSILTALVSTRASDISSTY